MLESSAPAGFQPARCLLGKRPGQQTVSRNPKRSQESRPMGELISQGTFLILSVGRQKDWEHRHSWCRSLLFCTYFDGSLPSNTFGRFSSVQVGESLGPAARFCRVLLSGSPRSREMRWFLPVLGTEHVDRRGLPSDPKRRRSRYSSNPIFGFVNIQSHGF